MKIKFRQLVLRVNLLLYTWMIGHIRVHSVATRLLHWLA